MNKRFELILHEVCRLYRSERAFYHADLGITQRTWEKYKSGEIDFDNIKLSTYNRMIGLLFTPYESMLIDAAIQDTNLNKYENVVDAFYNIKYAHAKYMLSNGANIEKFGSILDNEYVKYRSIARIKILDALSNVITFEIKSTSNLPIERHLRMPSGADNRRDWFDKYFNTVVIK